MEAGAKSGVLKGTKSFNFGSLFGASLTPWRHRESFMELSGLEKCHLRRLLMSDLILGLILDLPKCAEQGSRCSLSLVFVLLACLKMTQKWTSKWSPLRAEISARLLLGPSRNDFGGLFCASVVKLKNVSKVCRNGVVLVVCRPGVRPWSLHRLSIEFPWSLHRISIEFPWSLHRGNIDSAATRTPTYIPDARNQKV